MKTLQEICLANPLKVRFARVHFERTSDYDHFIGHRDSTLYLNCPLELAVSMWKHSLEHVEKNEIIHKYTNYELLREIASQMASQVPSRIKTLVPTIETLVYDGLENETRNKIEEGEVSQFVRTEIEHQTTRIIQVYVPGYHAEYAGQSIDIEPEILWNTVVTSI